ncbi:hypothetical protein Hanom_Chr11g01044421 [Helianthus anomalus]
MKAKSSFRTRRPLDILRIYDAAEGLLLLANSPPLMAIGEEKPLDLVPSMVVSSNHKDHRPKGTVDKKIDVLSVEDLMTRFLMIRKGGCQLVYCCRKNLRGDQVPVVDDGPAAD